MIKLSHYTLKQLFHSAVHYTKYPFSSAAGRCPHVSKVGIETSKLMDYQKKTTRYPCPFWTMKVFEFILMFFPCGLYENNNIFF